MKNLKNYLKGFTLVELIIVITILAILGTIAYISFQGYTKDARDGVRISDIKQIYNGLSIYKTQTEKTLLPDNYINIQSGTTTISYQGYAGANVLRTLKVSGGKDPGTKDYYIYTTDVNTKKAQLMTYMETSDKDVQLLSKVDKLNIINQANAITNTGYYQDKKIYVYGDKIGILTDSNKVPLQETTTNTGIDITSLTGNITTYFGGNVYSGGLSSSTGLTLVNQINGAITGKLPCSPTTYNGYTITSLQDTQSGSFMKVVNNSPLIQTGSIIATCNNGTLNYSGESTQNGCIGGYIWNGSSCSLNSYFSGDGTNGNPYRINGVSAGATTTIATSCQYYNINSTTNSNGNGRGTGTCGNGSQECLANGVYLIDVDGAGGNNAFQVYCDMNTDGGGWTLITSRNSGATDNTDVTNSTLVTQANSNVTNRNMNLPGISQVLIVNDGKDSGFDTSYDKTERFYGVSGIGITWNNILDSLNKNTGYTWNDTTYSAGSGDGWYFSVVRLNTTGCLQTALRTGYGYGNYGGFNGGGYASKGMLYYHWGAEIWSGGALNDGGLRCDTNYRMFTNYWQGVYLR